MRVLILGATGPSGILVIHEYFRVYPAGTAVLYVRNPSKLSSDISSNLAITVIQGELTDADALRRAFVSGGQIDAVLSTLGPVPPYSKEKLITRGYTTLIPVMASHKCKRLIALSTFSHKDPRDKFALLPWLMVSLVWLFMSGAYEDIITFSKYIQEECDKNDIDWTLVRVPGLTMKEGQKAVAGYVGDGNIGVILSRHALAEFFVKAIEEKKWVRKSPAISS